MAFQWIDKSNDVIRSFIKKLKKAVDYEEEEKKAQKMFNKKYVWLFATPQRTWSRRMPLQMWRTAVHLMSWWMCPQDASTYVDWTSLHRYQNNENMTNKKKNMTSKHTHTHTHTEASKEKHKARQKKHRPQKGGKGWEVKHVRQGVGLNIDPHDGANDAHCRLK